MASRMKRNTRSRTEILSVLILYHVGTDSNLGAVSQMRGDAEEAIAHYRTALRIEPDHADAHYNLGSALYILGQHQEALRHFNEALVICREVTARNEEAVVLNNIGAMHDHFDQPRSLGPGRRTGHR